MLEIILEAALEYLIPICELIGLLVVAVALGKALVGWGKGTFTGTKAEVSVGLDEGLSLGLGFLLGAEIMKTIQIHSLESAAVVAAIFGLRALMSLLLHHEMKQERAAEREKKEDLSPED